MRRVIYGLGGLLLMGAGALAQGVPARTAPPGTAPAATPGAVTAKPVPAASSGKVASQGLRATADNDQARRLEDERYKRWDDRMRRATKSMCDRC